MFLNFKKRDDWSDCKRYRSRDKRRKSNKTFQTFRIPRSNKGTEHERHRSRTSHLQKDNWTIRRVYHLQVRVGQRHLIHIFSSSGWIRWQSAAGFQVQKPLEESLLEDQNQDICQWRGNLRWEQLTYYIQKSRITISNESAWWRDLAIIWEQ